MSAITPVDTYSLDSLPQFVQWQIFTACAPDTNISFVSPLIRKNYGLWVEMISKRLLSAINHAIWTPSILPPKDGETIQEIEKKLFFIIMRKVDDIWRSSSRDFKQQYPEFSGETLCENPSIVNTLIQADELALLNLLSKDIPQDVRDSSEWQNSTLWAKITSFKGTYFRSSYTFKGLPLNAIPASIGDLRTLTRLILSRNNLVELPASIGNLHGLTNLDLSVNRLRSLPETLYRCPSLANLNLSHNLLEFLPETICRYPRLIHLDLSHNKLQRLPLAITTLQLQTLDVTANEGLEKDRGTVCSLYLFRQQRVRYQCDPKVQEAIEKWLR